MKKKWITVLFFSLISFSCTVNSQREEILKSTNINEIEEYISKAHPEDPKRRLLKQRIIALKNAEWTKGKKDAKPMEARPVFVDLPNISSAKKNNEQKELLFKKLMSENSEQHKEKTVKLLNALFNEDISSNEAILLIKNNSDCNLVLEISGKKFYHLPVPAKGENSIVLNKDEYNLSGSLCDVVYQNKKEISKTLMMVLNNPGYKDSQPNIVKENTNPDRDLKNISQKKKLSKSKKRK
ncbi:DUF6759 domain-containing protein [Chryseobacterium echinoideorum]|uniref:DUF6759 domain-containing protein n=1 Tax=Chryseobacterium echinoideorum TaxID=1549648 RepID=UPI0016235690|nr:DUF6759 domain-containing protein [Chryseobacterium echinoideorum]